MLIPFPVAFLVGAFVTDLAFMGTGDGVWARVSMWLIGTAIVMALLAAPAGFADFFSEPRIRALSDAWYHMIGNLTAVVVAVINVALRLASGVSPCRPSNISNRRVETGASTPRRECASKRPQRSPED